MRAALFAAVLAAVAVASALNLALGGLWAVAAAGLLVARRRARGAAWLALAGAAAGGAGGAWLGVLRPPPPASYEEDELGWLVRLGRLGGRPGSPAPASPVDAVRARLDALRREELRFESAEIERRAAQAVTSALEARRLRDRAPVEVGALDEAVRQLALTVTAPEFRDLDGRRARLVRWLDELDTRLRMARDPSEAEAVGRALAPATMAPVSLRPLHEDLGRVNEALRALVRRVAGREVTVTAALRMEYDEAAGVVVTERRYAVHGAPIRRVDVDALRRRLAARGGAPTIAYRAGARGSREVDAGAAVELEEPAERVEVSVRASEAARAGRVRPPLRPIAFHRLTLSTGEGLPELGVGVTLGSAGAAVATVWVPAGPPQLEGIALPPGAFYFASASGRLEEGRVVDLWVPLPEGAMPGRVLHVELAPRSFGLRSRVTARGRPYLYTPNPAAALGLVGLAAAAVVLARRPRPRSGPAPAVPPP